MEEKTENMNACENDGLNDNQTVSVNNEAETETGSNEKDKESLFRSIVGILWNLLFFVFCMAGMYFVGKTAYGYFSEKWSDSEDNELLDCHYIVRNNSYKALDWRVRRLVEKAGMKDEFITVTKSALSLLDMYGQGYYERDFLKDFPSQIKEKFVSLTSYSYYAAELAEKILPDILRNEKNQRRIYDWLFPVVKDIIDDDRHGAPRYALQLLLNHLNSYMESYDHQKEREFYELCERSNKGDVFVSGVDYVVHKGILYEAMDGTERNPYRPYEAWIYRRVESGLITPEQIANWLHRLTDDLGLDKPVAQPEYLVAYSLFDSVVPESIDTVYVEQNEVYYGLTEEYLYKAPQYIGFEGVRELLTYYTTYYLIWMSEKDGCSDPWTDEYLWDENEFKDFITDAAWVDFCRYATPGLTLLKEKGCQCNIDSINSYLEFALAYTVSDSAYNNDAETYKFYEERKKEKVYENYNKEGGYYYNDGLDYEEDDDELDYSVLYAMFYEDTHYIEVDGKYYETSGNESVPKAYTRELLFSRLYRGKISLSKLHEGFEILYKVLNG